MNNCPNCGHKGMHFYLRLFRPNKVRCTSCGGKLKVNQTHAIMHMVLCIYLAGMLVLCFKDKGLGSLAFVFLVLIIMPLSSVFLPWADKK